MKATASKTRIRVLLADDHLIVREGICSTFRHHPVVKVVGQAATGVEAIAKVRKLFPDVILMDINMPQMNGLEATAAILKEFPDTKVLILTVHDTREYVIRVLRSGAQGYVLKDASPDELARAIQAVHLGHAFFSPRVANVVLHNYRDATQAGDNPVAGGLSMRETEVLRLIVKGRTTKEIAQQINVGARSVETYRARLMRKLNVRNAAELTSLAIEKRLL